MGRRAPRVLLASAVIVAALAIIGIFAIYPGLAGSGARAATATVDGRQYVLSIARSLDVPVDLLTEYGLVTELEADPEWFEGPTAYAVRDIDPATILVLRLRPDARDDGGSLGNYLVLRRGADAILPLCPYFDPEMATTPAECR